MHFAAAEKQAIWKCGKECVYTLIACVIMWNVSINVLSVKVQVFFKPSIKPKEKNDIYTTELTTYWKLKTQK